MVIFSQKIFNKPKTLLVGLMISFGSFETLVQANPEVYLKRVILCIETMEKQATLPGVGVIGSVSQLFRSLNEFLSEIDTSSQQLPVELPSMFIRINTVLKQGLHRRILSSKFLEQWDASYPVLLSSNTVSEWKTETELLLNLMITRSERGVPLEKADTNTIHPFTLELLLEDRASKTGIFEFLGYEELHRISMTSKSWLDHLTHLKSNATVKNGVKKGPYLTPAPEEEGSEWDYLIALKILDLANTNPSWRASSFLSYVDMLRREHLYSKVESLSSKCTPGSLPESFLRLILLPHMHHRTIDQAPIQILQTLTQQNFPFATLLFKNWHRLLTPKDQSVNAVKDDFHFPPSFRPERQMRNWMAIKSVSTFEKSGALLTTLLKGDFITAVRIRRSDNRWFEEDLDTAVSYWLRQLESWDRQTQERTPYLTNIKHFIDALLAQNKVSEAIDYLEQIILRDQRFFEISNREKGLLDKLAYKVDQDISDLLLRSYCLLSLRKAPKPYYEWSHPRIKQFLSPYFDLPISEKVRVSSRVPVSALLLLEESDPYLGHKRLRARGYEELKQYSEALALYQAVASVSYDEEDHLKILELMAKAETFDQARPWIEKLKCSILPTFTHLFPVIRAFHEANALPMIFDAIKPHLRLDETFSGSHFAILRPLIEYSKNNGESEFAFSVLALLEKTNCPWTLPFTDRVKYYHLYNQLAPVALNNPIRLENALENAKTDAIEAIAILLEDKKVISAENVRRRITELYEYIDREVPKEISDAI